MDTTRPVATDMSDFLARLGRHWWLAVLCVLAGIAAAYAFTQTQPKVYESTTSVLVQPVGDQDANVTGGRTKNEINLDTEAQLVSSTPVAADAAKLLQTRVSPDELAAGVSVEVPANTSVLAITYAADTPKAARAGSHSFAQAYLQNRQDSATTDLTNQLNIVNGKLQELGAQLARVNSQLAGMRGDNPTRPNLTSQRDTLQSQINTLTGRANQLSTTSISAGRIIRDANLPEQASRPNVLLNLASGSAAGLLLSVALALVRERLDRRVRRAADLARRTDLAVLATVPRAVKPRLDDVFPPFGAGGRIFNRLRNEVFASLPARTSRIVVVTGASRGAAATVVAANLAAAFARTGDETVLVSAQLPDSVGDAAPVTGMFDVASSPGLSDVLTGRVELDEAAQRPPRTPWLRVITTGGTASAGGLLQSQSLRDMLATLRGQAEFVVIEAPSTSSSADAQSLASLADAAILAVELRRTGYAETLDAVEQLRRVGTPVLGAVVLSRLPRYQPGPAREPVAEPADAAAPSPRPQPSPVNRHDPTVVLEYVEDEVDEEADAGDVEDTEYDPETEEYTETEEYEDAAYADDAEGPVDAGLSDAIPGYPMGPDRPASLESDTEASAARRPTATGVLAAFTEDGPLDGAR